MFTSIKNLQPWMLIVALTMLSSQMIDAGELTAGPTAAFLASPVSSPEF